MAHGYQGGASGAFRQDMSQQSVFKRSCIVIATVLALFVGIVIMFVRHLRSSVQLCALVSLTHSYSIASLCFVVVRSFFLSFSICLSLGLLVVFLCSNL